ncbi:hypothetical protein [uncultured Chitinophaga sp.]|uniref:OmpP1/FadL family transporter n=1 Tax=uncultured Chitinophaga sp. TaxID=339340 RepID=UPI0025D6F786|nr:hypothetical protein [uncultured Chitinophaga sp.]
MNKRITGLLVALCVSGGQLMAQDEADALRYSRTTPGGTARTQAIGGAAGSLGGDYSAAHVNPAGLGFFKTNEFVITPGFYFRSNDYNYRGINSNDSKSGITLPNAGLIFGMPVNNQNSMWRNVTLSLGFNRVADFNNKRLIDGDNNQHSLSEKYLEDLINNNVTSVEGVRNNFPLGASLAYETYLIDTIANASGGITGFRSNVFPEFGLRQLDRIEEKGGIDEFAIGFGANFADKLYWGLSLNIPSIHYERNRFYEESDNSEGTPDDDPGFRFWTLDERLKTDAVGFNAKLGLTYTPNGALRLGAAFHTPTWYSLKDVSTAEIRHHMDDYDPDGQGPDRIQSTLDITDGYPVEYEYSLRTPWKGLVSASYIIGANSADVKKQLGFITADLEYVNYSAQRYKFNKGSGADRDYAEALNNSMSEMYKGAFNLRLGGEMKFNTFAARLGYAYSGSPYEDADMDGSNMKFSGGLGYRNKGFFIDLTYVHTLAKDTYYPFKLQDDLGMPVTAAKGDLSGGNILMSVGFKF